jgi:hypothetical protein
VACRLAMEHGLDLATVVAEADARITLFGRNQTGSFLPSEVKEWFGFDCDDPQLLITEEQWNRTDLSYPDTKKAAASALNDDLMLGFVDIATAFERTFLEAPDGA